MKRSCLVAVAWGFVLLSACGGGQPTDGTAEHSHAPGTEEHHDHGPGVFAFGEPADPAQADQTIEIVASDAPFRFEPDDVKVAAGDTVLFELVNDGEVEHEFVLLEEPTQGVAGGHEHGAADPNATPRVEPGDSHQLAWMFTEPGRYVYECHVDAHHLTGMRGTVTVAG